MPWLWGLSPALGLLRAEQGVEQPLAVPGGWELGTPGLGAGPASVWLCTVRRGDVLAAWSGIRPLVTNPDSKDTQSLSRNHVVTVSDSGLITVAGTGSSLKPWLCWASLGYFMQKSCSMVILQLL